MTSRNNHNTLCAQGHKLINRAADFARECLASSDINALYDFTAKLCSMLESIEDEHEQARLSAMRYWY